MSTTPSKGPEVVITEETQASHYSYNLSIEGSSIPLFSSGKHRNGHYANLDIFMLLFHANSKNINLLNLLRILYVELSQVYTPTELENKIEQGGYALNMDEESMDEIEPTDMLSVLHAKITNTKVEGVDSATTENYFNLLLHLFSGVETCITKEHGKKETSRNHKEEIKTFLSNKAEGHKINAFDSSSKDDSTQRDTEEEIEENPVLTEELKNIIQKASPLAYAMIKGDNILIEVDEEEKSVDVTVEKTPTTVGESKKDEQNEEYSNPLLPLGDGKYNGLSKQEIKECKKIFKVKSSTKITIRLK